MEELRKKIILRKYEDAVEIHPDTLEALLDIAQESEHYATDNGIGCDSNDLRRLRKALSRLYRLNGRRVVE